MFRKCCRIRKWCKRSAGERKEVFEKYWGNGRMYSRNGGRVEGGVQEVLEEWKGVFKKCCRSLTTCSIKCGKVEGYVQEGLEE